MAQPAVVLVDAGQALVSPSQHLRRLWKVQLAVVRSHDFWHSVDIWLIPRSSTVPDPLEALHELLVRAIHIVMRFFRRLSQPRLPVDALAHPRAALMALIGTLLPDELGDGLWCLAREQLLHLLYLLTRFRGHMPDVSVAQNRLFFE